MARTTEMTVEQALRRAANGDLLIPAIQRDFVWSEGQICDLFDSAMRGYPIGTLLVWQLSGDVARNIRWYRLLDRVDRNSPLNRSKAAAKGASVSAVLDGQQRLTAFNIGINGAIRPKSSNPAVAEQVLWIDAAAEHLDTEPGTPRYGFFFDVDDHNQLGDDGECWVKVSDIARAANRTAVRQLLPKGSPPGCLDVVDLLRKVVQDHPIVSWQTVKDDDVDGVLNIFIKANSKGTALKHEDMMLAIANSVWSGDAGQKVRQLRSDLANRFGFNLSLTRIMKSSIVLLGTGRQLGFQASNLTRSRLRKMEQNWEASSDALRVAAKMLQSFGLNQRTLTAENVIIPLAIYAQHRGLAEDWVARKSSEPDLERIRMFVYRSLIKKEFWTGAIDPVLLVCREVITKKSTGRSFPLQALVAELAKIAPAKDLDFTSAEIEALLTTTYRERRAALLLSVLYPSMTDPGGLDKDHVFPRSKVTQAGLKRAGITSDTIYHRVRHRAEELPNLCLLGEPVNRGLKGSKTPAAWLDAVATAQSPGARTRLIRELDLQYAPSDIGEVEAFWTKRKRRMRKRLEQLLS